MEREEREGGREVEREVEKGVEEEVEEGKGSVAVNEEVKGREERRREEAEEEEGGRGGGGSETFSKFESPKDSDNKSAPNRK